MFCFGEPGVSEDLHALVDEGEDVCDLAMLTDENFGRGCVWACEPLDEAVCHDAVTSEVGVNVVALIGECGVDDLAGVDGAGHGGVEVDDIPSASALGDEPFGEGCEGIGVVEIFFIIAVVVVVGRGDENDLGTCLFCLGFEFDDARFVGVEAFFVDGHVDAIIHAVTGEDEIWLELSEDALEAGVEVRSGEFAASVTFLREARGGFGGETQIYHKFVFTKWLVGEP